MYETGTALQVTAFHVMPGMLPPEGERHSHDYRFDVVVRRDDLDERGMVVDLDLLDRALRDTAARVDGVDLETVVPAEAVTVEVFARWDVDRRRTVAVALLGELPLRALATTEFPFDDAPAAYRALDEREPGVVHVALRYQ